MIKSLQIKIESKTIKYLLALILLYTNTCFAQTKTYQEKYDSITNISVDKNQTKQEKLQANLNKLDICEFIPIDSSEINNIYTEALYIALETNNKQAEFKAKYNYAKKMIVESNYHLAEQILLEIKNKISQQDSELRFKINIKLATIYRLTAKYNNALQLLTVEEKQASRSNNKIYLLETLLQKGILFFAEENNTLSLKYLYQTLEIITEQQVKISDNTLAKIQLTFGSVFYMQGNNNATPYLLKAKEIYTQLGDYRGICLSDIYIGRVCFALKNYDKARLHYKLALESANSIKENGLCIYILNYLSEIDLSTGNYDSAINNLTLSLKIAQQIKARNTGDIYSLLAEIYIKKNELNKADTLLKLAQQTDYAINDYYNEKTNAALVKLYLKKQDYIKAISILKKSIKKEENLHNKQQFYNDLSKIYTQTHQYKEALFYYKRYKQITDSIQNNNTEQQLLSLSLQQQFDKDVKEIEHQKDLMEHKKDLEFNTQRTIIAVIFLFILIFILLIIFLTQRHKTKTQEIQKLKVERRMANISELINRQEKERIKYAEKLHEDISGNLSSIKFFLSTSSNNNHARTISLLDNSIKGLREISYRLAPPSLQKINLIETIKQYIITHPAKNNIVFDFQHFGELPPNIDTTNATAVYRIVQELVDNIIEHSHATEAIVQINCDNETINITIEDNGTSYDIENITKGVGLKNIFTRIDLLDANIDIQSDKNGTNIEININIENIQKKGILQH